MNQPLNPKTPLPWVQLLTIFLIQFSEPITATVVYPFIPQFVMDTGITGGDEKSVGYYAGIIVSTRYSSLLTCWQLTPSKQSIFFVSESLTVYPWAKLSDYIGRRPTLLLGPLGLAL